MKSVHVVVLNYNGEQLLPECLPSIVAAVGKAKHPSRLTVIENCSPDGSARVLREQFAEVAVYAARENRVLCSYNDFVKTVSEDIVVLLNNDIRVEEDFIDPLVEVYERNPDTFLVSARSFLFDGSYEGGKSLFFLKYGVFGTTCRFPGFERFRESFGITHQAGFGAYSREKFLALGGFDDLYLPGRLEDSDLCFRAWKRGWPSYYQPASVIHHKGGASFLSRYGSSKTLMINFRNTFLFMWKNLSDARILFGHLAWMFPRMGADLLRGRPEMALGFLKALPRLPRSLAKRRAALAGAIRNDSEIFYDPNFYSHHN